MNKAMRDLYKAILVEKRKIMFYKSKQYPNIFRIKIDRYAGSVYLCPNGDDVKLCARIFDWELYPKKTEYI